MLVDRESVISHFRHIHLGGEIQEATFTDNLKCTAISGTDTILIRAEGLPGGYPLPEPVGIIELPTVIKALERLSPQRLKVAIDFDTANGVFSFSTENNGRVCFATSTPQLIATHVDPEFVDGFVSRVTDGDSAPISQTFSELIRNAAAIIDGKVITLAVRETGTQVRVGSPSRGEFCEFIFPALKSSEAYELHLDADDLIPVLKETQDYTRADLFASGPDGLVAVREGPYTYVLSALADDGSYSVDLNQESQAEGSDS